MAEADPRMRETPGSIVVVDPAEDRRWARLVEEHRSSVFQTQAWHRVLAASYGFPLRARVLLSDDGVPVAGISYAEIDDFLGPRLVSLPFSDFCDPVVSDRATWDVLVDDLVATGRRLDLRCLGNSIPVADDRFAVVGQAAWHGVELQRDLDEIWMSLHASARRAIRKADGAGVAVKMSTSEEDVAAFFRLHLRVRKYKYGLLAQPYRFFQETWRQFIEPGRGFVLLATLDDRPVGGIVFLEWQDTLYYKFNASDIAALPARPNDRLIWEAVQIAKDRGLRMLDFGLSDLDQDGLVRYKAKYATEEGRITRLRHAPPGEPSDAVRDARAMLGQLTEILVGDDVPDEVTARSGDLLYRYFG